MKSQTFRALAMALVAISVTSVTAYPADSGTPTLWHWLGVPQGYNKVKDARINKSGNHPAKERKPPLKRIADPENFESPNPAIKAAAKIKAEEDLAPQKIKAIKYLATVGCGCYTGVRDALLAALEDCTEEVRYQAAIALCQAAGNPCKNCDKTGCCNAEVMNKLNEMAHGQDAKGCFVESSARVRAAATNALNACKRKNPTTPMQPIPIQDKELPVEGAQPGTKELPTEPNSEKPVLTPAAPLPPGDRHDAPPPNLHLTGYTREGDVSETDDSSLPDVSNVADANATTIAEQVSVLRQGGHRGYVPCPPQPCPPQPCPEQPQPVTPAPEVQPGETPPPTGEQTPSENLAGNVPPTNALASDFGATSGPLSSAPNMIGDQFGGNTGASRIVRHFAFSNLTAVPPQSSPFYTVNGSGTPVALNQEVQSPPVQNYVLLDYNDASGRLGGVPLASVPAGGTLVGGSTIDTSNTTFTSEFDVAYDVNVPSPGGAEWWDD